MMDRGEKVRRAMLIFDSHPVQYKAPVYQELERQIPGQFKVIYATDCSLRGHQDKDFGREVAWDVPLLAGYPSQVINNENGVPLKGFWSLHGRGLGSLLRREKPRAVLISQLNYLADFVLYGWCVLLGIPVWIRHETQDESAPRRAWTALKRDIFYFLVYLNIDHAFYVGQLNRRHLLQHGVDESKMSFAPYCVTSPVETMSPSEKGNLRRSCRAEFGVTDDEILVLFSGKLIEKKDPLLLIRALEALGAEQRKRFRLVYLGSGVMEQELRKRAAPLGDRVKFAGFQNQSELPRFYLAADIFALPSRRMYESWGLVVNEALQAGCAVVMTDAVGCYAEFGEWARVQVIGEGDASGCAAAFVKLARFERSFDWCEEGIRGYSSRAAASAISVEARRSGRRD